MNCSLLSKEYEKIFNTLTESGVSSADAVLILNDLFVCVIACKKDKKKFSNLDKAWNYYFEKYPELIFSVNKNFETNIDSLREPFISINNAIDSSKDLDTFESVLGTVLEKHINRKETGSYYTPEDTTKFICWNAIFISLLNKLPHDLQVKISSAINISNNVDFVDKKLTFEEKINIIKETINEDDLLLIADRLKTIRIMEPTCGSGAFIISAYECIKFLNESLLLNGLDKKSYYSNIYGIDIQTEAVLLTKCRLIIRALIDNNVNDHFVNCLKTNFIAADALKGSDRVIKGKEGLNWNRLGIFDCVVGNPPYVERKGGVGFSHYTTAKCGNLYAYAIERACHITSESSVVSFIVPLPLISTPRMKNVRDYLETHSSIVYYSTFADRPGCLFSGVHQRLTIFFASISSITNNETRIFTSSYKFWYKNERNSLFKSLDFIENNHPSLPKIGTSIENSIFVKNQICTDSLFSLANDDGKNNLYISSRIGFWAKAFLEKPKTNEITVLHFKTDRERRIAYCFVNSSLFYYLWVLNSDCWHITNADFKNIKFNYSSLNENDCRKLIQLSHELDADLERNKVRINSKQTEFEYKHKFSKKIIDKIDDIICKRSGLDLNETKYVKNYTLKYRMNKINEEELK